VARASCGGGEAPRPLSFSTFDADLQLLASVLAGRPEAAAADARALLPALWVFAYVLPLTVPPEEREADAVGVARNIWLQWREEGEEVARAEVVEEVKRRLGVLVCSTDVCVTYVLTFFISFTRSWMLTLSSIGRKTS
jgi:hypothetical protein